MNIPVFKCRASAIGKIMTNSRGKTRAEKVAALQADVSANQARLNTMKDGLKSKDTLRLKIQAQMQELETLQNSPFETELSTTCTNYLKEWLNEQLYSRRSEVKTRYTDKGNIVEDSSIAFAQCHIPEMGFCSKNWESAENDYIIGTCDVLTETHVFDLKNSWSNETFPIYETAIPEDGYEWQLRGYMWLYGVENAGLIYTLMDAPDEIIEKEARYKLPYGFDREQYEAFSMSYKYEHLPAYLRIKKFSFQRNREIEISIAERVMECRKYIDTVLMPMIEAQMKIYK